MTKRKFFIMAASATQQFDSKSMPIGQAVATERQWQRVGLNTQVCERRRNGTIKHLIRDEVLTALRKSEELVITDIALSPNRTWQEKSNAFRDAFTIEGKQTGRTSCETPN